MMMDSKRKPDVLDALMSAPEDDFEAEEAGGDVEVMSFGDDDDMAAEAPEEGTPEATIASIRKGLDELELMLGG